MLLESALMSMLPLFWRTCRSEDQDFRPLDRSRSRSDTPVSRPIEIDFCQTEYPVSKARVTVASARKRGSCALLDHRIAKSLISWRYLLYALSLHTLTLHNPVCPMRDTLHSFQRAQCWFAPNLVTHPPHDPVAVLCNAPRCDGQRKSTRLEGAALRTAATDV